MDGTNQGMADTEGPDPNLLRVLPQPHQPGREEHLVEPGWQLRAQVLEAEVLQELHLVCLHDLRQGHQELGPAAPRPRAGAFLGPQAGQGPLSLSCSVVVMRILSRTVPQAQAHMWRFCLGTSSMRL